jgi:3-oxoadipate enol-lactonase
MSTSTPGTTGTFKTADGCDIGYTVHAANRIGAPRVALIHSLAMDRSFWDGVVDALAGRVEVLTFDCRGHGKSGHVAGPYSPEQFAHDLAALLDRLGWIKTSVAGCSMGGCVAQAFAGLYPQRATSLTLIDTTAWYGEDAPKVWRERGTTGVAKGLASLTAFQVTRWFGDAFRAAEPAKVEAAVAVFLANTPACYAATCEMLGDADVRKFLPAMRMPVQIIVGEEDYATPVAMAEQMHKAIAQSSLTVIPGARHLTPIERPQEIANRIAAQLQAA